MIRGGWRWWEGLVTGEMIEMAIQDNELVMKEKCFCEGCDSKKILKHFEECPKCFSRAYHVASKELNIKIKKIQEKEKK